MSLCTNHLTIYLTFMSLLINHPLHDLKMLVDMQTIGLLLPDLYDLTKKINIKEKIDIT